MDFFAFFFAIFVILASINNIFCADVGSDESNSTESSIGKCDCNDPSSMGKFCDIACP